MLGTIFSFETKRWFKNISFYVYILVFFSFSLLSMGASLGYFDLFGTTTASVNISNSPIAINGMIEGFSRLLYFFVPMIIGATVYRDFKYNMHTILFSYPFTKFDYLVGKFLSGFVITIIITSAIAFGLFVACILPFGNPELLGPIQIWPFMQTFILFTIPNIFIIGTFVFALVTLTRNVSAGFIFVVVVFIASGILSQIASNSDDKYMYALIDPFGSEALSYLTKYWTIDERNFNNIPFEGVIIYNRLIWIGVSLLVFIGTFFSFSFNQMPMSLGRKKKGARFTKNNFESIKKINLPKVSLNYSFKQNLINVFALSRFEFKSIVYNRIFIAFMIIILIVVIFSGYSLGNEIYGTGTYPVTWKVIDVIGGIVSFFISIMIYLFSGVLIQNGVNNRMNLLVDATPTPNWVLFFSKVIAMIKMTLLLLLVSIFAGILIQVYYGYYQFEILHYFMEFFVLKLVGYLILILFSLFVQSLLKNYLVGFFIIFAFMIVKGMVYFIGIEQDVFIFNSGPGYDYSDMNGYGVLREFFIYKGYWLLFTLALSCLTLLFWRRGIVVNLKERLSIAKKRFTYKIAIPFIVFLIAFFSLGYAIYYHDNVLETRYSSQEYELQSVDWEKKYKKYEDYAQPRIMDVKVDMNIFPNERDYNATVYYVMLNKSDKPIDSLFIDYHKNLQYIKFDRENTLVSKDTILNFDIYRLAKPLLPGEELRVEFKVQNQYNTFLTDRSPVVGNGTFMNNSIFPSFGYSDSGEISDNDVRKKYGLPNKERMAEANDPKARMNTYISEEADWITFETTVSTSEDQIAIAPGYLQKEWVENGRRYFHYKMDSKMLNFYAFNSGRYEVKRDKLGDINLEIYYHKGHEYNLDRMMDGMKKSLAYYSENYSPYQHKQARIIEFPKTMGTFAQAFANTMPFSEGFGFIADVDSDNPNAVDYPFSVVSHEMAHQWWAHQVIGANVKGATLLSESMSEYSSLMVLQHKYGKAQMRKFLKEALDDYLMGRTYEWKFENPLMFNENQQYIHYNKGSLVLYALSDLMGEKKFNDIMKGYVAEVAFQDAPYTNSIEFVDHIRRGTPDSLQYVIKDMFETITLYDNKVKNVTSKKLPDGNYMVEIEFNVSKYRASDKGTKTYIDENGATMSFKDGKENIQSYPLNDYVEVGIFGAPIKKGKYEIENELYNKKYKINKINNKVQIEVKEKPTEVGVDPYNKLIDTNSDDNRMKVK